MSRCDHYRSPISQREIEVLVKRLNSLSEGEGVIAMLVACGPPAIEPLQRFLLEGRPSTVFQPRQWAVKALAELGAKDALIAYVSSRNQITDAATRWGEEAVESAAARELARWKTDEVFDCLMKVATVRSLQGAIDALGEFSRVEAIPLLIRALGDDVARRSAEDALRKLGAAARDILIETARTPDPSRRRECSSSLIRRRCALKLFSALPARRVDYAKIEALIYDADSQLAATAARIFLKSDSRQAKAVALFRMVQLISASDWLVQSDIEDALLSNFELVKPAIEEEIRLRMNACQSPAVYDHVLSLLLRIKHKAIGIERGVE